MPRKMQAAMPSFSWAKKSFTQSGMPNPNFERLWKLYLNSFTIRLSLAKQALNGRSSSKGTRLDQLRLTCA